LLGGLVVCCILLAVAIMLVLGMNLFVVKDVQISGGINLTRAQIMDAVGIRLGQSLFSVSASSIKSKLEATPQLVLESVTRKYPSKVVLTVRETTPTLVMGYSNQFITLDGELRVLSQEGSLPGDGYPLVTGVVVRTATVAQPIVVDDKLQMDALKAICTAFTKRSDSAADDTYAAMHYVTEISLADVDNIVLYTQNGYTVQLGNTENMDRKALWVEQMVPMFIQKGYTGGTLDVSGGESATFIPQGGQGVATTTPTESSSSNTTSPPSWSRAVTRTLRSFFSPTETSLIFSKGRFTSAAPM
jgi:cell division septal protein FtsQ